MPAANVRRWGMGSLSPGLIAVDGRRPPLHRSRPTDGREGEEGVVDGVAGAVQAALEGIDESV